MKKSVKLIVLLISLAMTATLCLACGTGGSSNDESNASQDTPSANSATPAATEQTDPYATRQAANAWAQEVFEATMENMEAEAGFDYVPGQNPTFATGFDDTRDTGYVPLFQNSELRDQLINAPVTLPGKVITAGSDDDSFTAYDTSEEDLLPGQPRFQYWEFEEADPALFADTVEECDTLVIYKSFATKVDEEYYDTGDDRIHVSTFVFVIDVNEKRLLHIKSVATDAPGNITSTTVGSPDREAALAYMAGLFGIPLI